MTDLWTPRNHEFLDNGGMPVIYAHQGGIVVAPGNAMASFEHAWELGYMYLETDGRATKGGELVAIHDHYLNDGKIENRLVSSLSKADRLAIQRDGHPLVLIGDIYDAFPDARISLDIKPDNSVWEFGDNSFNDPGVDMAIKLVKAHQARTCIASFATKNLLELRAALPDAASAMSFEEMVEVASLIKNPNHVPDIDIGGDIASVEEVDPIFGRIISSESIAALHGLGKVVHIWTINNRRDMHRLLDMNDPRLDMDSTAVGTPGNKGIDGFYTDVLGVARDVMIGRGQWRNNRAA